MSEPKITDVSQTPLILPLVQKGIRDHADVQNLLSLLSLDRSEGRITPGVNNAILKAVEKVDAKWKEHVQSKGHRRRHFCRIH